MHNFKKYISVFFCIGVLFVIGCSEDNPVEPTETHNEAEGLILRTDGQDLVIVKEGTVKSGQITVNVDSQTPTIKAVFLDEDDDEFEPHEEGSSLAFEFGSNETAEAVMVDGKQWEFVVNGKKVGTTTLVVKLMHGDHSDFLTPNITVSVTE